MSPLIMSAVSMYLACCGGLGGRAGVRGDASWMGGGGYLKKKRWDFHIDDSIYNSCCCRKQAPVLI